MVELVGGLICQLYGFVNIHPGGIKLINIVFFEYFVIDKMICGVALDPAHDSHVGVDTSLLLLVDLGYVV